MRALATCASADTVAPVRRLISSGSTFEEQIGYSRAVVDGDWIHVSGTTGFDYATMTISGDVVEQAEQALANVAAALAEAGCTFADVVRVRYLLPDARRLRGVLAGAAAGVRRGAAGGDDAGVRPERPADADRDRGHRAAALNARR